MKTNKDFIKPLYIVSAIISTIVALIYFITIAVPFTRSAIKNHYIMVMVMFIIINSINATFGWMMYGDYKIDDELTWGEFKLWPIFQELAGVQLGLETYLVIHLVIHKVVTIEMKFLSLASAFASYSLYSIATMVSVIFITKNSYSPIFPFSINLIYCIFNIVLLISTCLRDKNTGKARFWIMYIIVLYLLRTLYYLILYFYKENDYKILFGATVIFYLFYAAYFFYGFMFYLTIKDTSNRTAKFNYGSIINKPILSNWIPESEIKMIIKIGAGASAQVYHGSWNGTDIAVKILYNNGFREYKQDMDILKEANFLKSLKHPNIVQFLGLTALNENTAIVMNYMEKGSLMQNIAKIKKNAKNWPKNTKIDILLDIAKGMNYLHCLNPPVIHRDLKSPNVLLDKHWNACVADFGLSKMLVGDYAMSIIGTPRWSAPEVLKRENHNAKCDVWSYGVIVWEVATYNVPYGENTPNHEIDYKYILSKKNKLKYSEHKDGLLADLIDKCLEPNHKDRPSFSEILETIKEEKQLSSHGQELPIPIPPKSGNKKMSEDYVALRDILRDTLDSDSSYV